MRLPLLWAIFGTLGSYIGQTNKPLQEKVILIIYLSIHLFICYNIAYKL